MPKKVKKLRPAKVKHRPKSVAQQAREQEYRKVRSRVQHRLSKYRVKGYDVSNIAVPAIPKRITEGSIKRLSKITPAYIRKRSTVATAMDISTGEVTQSVSGEQYFREQQKASRRKAIETRKRKKVEAPADEEPDYSSRPGSGEGYEDAPHIGDLMRAKIENLISQYNIENSDLAKRVQDWLDQADEDGSLNRLSKLSSDMLNDLEEDFRYTAQGKQPKYDGINALHWALTGGNLTGQQWRDIQEGYEQDFGADQFDEESFFGDTDDDDDY